MISAPLLVALVTALAGLTATELAIIGVLLGAVSFVTTLVGAVATFYYGERQSN